jgi:hypothetical protein
MLGILWVMGKGGKMCFSHATNTKAWRGKFFGEKRGEREALNFLSLILPSISCRVERLGKNILDFFLFYSIEILFESTSKYFFFF